MIDKTKQQNTNQNAGGKNMYTKNVVWPNEFKELFTFLNIIKSHFKDFCVVHGQFRSRSNDLTCVVETYFGYFSEMDLIISDINALVKMLSTLDKRSEIDVTVDDKTVSFTDGYQNFKIDKLSQEYCDNKFLPVEELESIFPKEIESYKPLIKETLPKQVVCNINKVSRDFKVKTARFHHEEDNLNKGYILISSPTGYGSSVRSREYTIKLKEDLLTAMDKDHYFNISTFPYVFNKSDMTLDFKFFNDPNILAIIHYTKIEELSITIYARAAYTKNDNE